MDGRLRDRAHHDAGEVGAVADERVRVAVVTTESFFSYSILRGAVTDPAIDCRAMVILPSSGSGSPARTLRKVYQRSGPRLVAYKAVTAGVVGARGLIARGRRAGRATPSALAERVGVLVHRARDCNDESVVGLLLDADFDVLVSINVYQRMRETLLSTPRLAALNTHFGMLPEYRGMSPVLWAMSQGESEIGLTIHKMVLAFDEGSIVRQQALPLRPRESVLSATVRGCEIARGMLVDAIHDVAADPGVGRPQTGDGSYYSLPTREAILQLNAGGRRLWRMADLPKLR